MPPKGAAECKSPVSKGEDDDDEPGSDAEDVQQFRDVVNPKKGGSKKGGSKKGGTPAKTSSSKKGGTGKQATTGAKKTSATAKAAEEFVAALNKAKDGDELPPSGDMKRVKASAAPNKYYALQTCKDYDENMRLFMQVSQSLRIAANRRESLQIAALTVACLSILAVSRGTGTPVVQWSLSKLFRRRIVAQILHPFRAVSLEG